MHNSDDNERRDVRENTRSAHGRGRMPEAGTRNSFWPGINQQVKDFVQQCDTCQTFRPRQQRETLIPHPIVEQPWIKAADDLFSFDGRDYLITVDHYSNYWEVDFLAGDTSSPNIINKLRAQFARYGIPRTLITDNGLQFSCWAFGEFAQRWEFQHITSSPEHPQSNGKAESAVKTAKSIIRAKQSIRTRMAGSQFLLTEIRQQNIWDRAQWRDFYKGKQERDNQRQTSSWNRG